jgi:hypothetical protein
VELVNARQAAAEQRNNKLLAGGPEQQGDGTLSSTVTFFSPTTGNLSVIEPHCSLWCNRILFVTSQERGWTVSGHERVR